MGDMFDKLFLYHGLKASPLKNNDSDIETLNCYSSGSDKCNSDNDTGAKKTRSKSGLGERTKASLILSNLDEKVQTLRNEQLPPSPKKNVDLTVGEKEILVYVLLVGELKKYNISSVG
ncbi:hypothetical protein HZS_5602 [Henneguya salminicola]|nr:hypothetical protein HZS_5602 [Henneguya salminicola]